MCIFPLMIDIASYYNEDITGSYNDEHGGFLMMGIASYFNDGH